MNVGVLFKGVIVGVVDYVEGGGGFVFYVVGYWDYVVFVDYYFFGEGVVVG